jgi:hypothetical protein
MVGIWIQTNSLSRRGLLLLNSTLVKPGYEGHLSAHFANLGSSPIILSSSSTIAKLLFLELDVEAKELVDSSQFSKYDVMVDGLAAQSTRSFLRISKLVPDLSKAAESSIADARKKIESFTADSIAATKESITDMRQETLLKIGGGFVGGFILAVAFALWIFPWLRDIDFESKDRITEIVIEQNAELADIIEVLQNDLNEIKSAITNGSVSAPEVQGESR